MSGERKEALLAGFEYEEMAVPRNYGALIPLGQFLEEVEEGRHKPYTGDGYLVLNGKFIDHSKEWVYSRLVPFGDTYMTLWELDEEVEGLQVFWVTASTFLF